MITFEIVSRLPSVLSQTLIQKTARVLERTLGKKTRTIGVNFVSEKEIQRLNKIYRGKNKPTDVLSFLVDGGDLVIAAEYAKREAKRRGIDVQEELIRLLIHGTLHLYGYDHGTEKEEMKMFSLQEECVERVFTLSV